MQNKLGKIFPEESQDINHNCKLLFANYKPVTKTECQRVYGVLRNEKN